jgi:DNA transposition AAA+ family ATPase
MQPHPWKLTAEELQQRIDHCPPNQKALLAWAWQHALDRNLPQTAFCEASGINPSTLSKFLCGTYVDPRRPDLAYDLPEHIVQALSSYQAALAAAAPTTVGFVSTDTSRKIFFNCELARESRSPVFLMGASHIGKTTALCKYRDANPTDTTLVTVTSGMGAKGLAVAICEEMGISASGSLSLLTRRLGRALSRGRLLILDDFHVLTLSSTPRTFLAAMEFLRALYDADNCGMLFSTTDLDYNRILKDHKNTLHQLLRRGVHRPHLGDAPLQKDVRSIIEAHGLRWPNKSLLVLDQCPWKIIAALAQNSGLKGVTERLRYALKLAARAATPVTWAHYCQADSAVASNATAPQNDWA